jgi:hypothetical protein
MLRGSCLCGKVRYEIHGDPWFMYHCHCATCRRANGSSFATNIIVAATDFVLLAGRDALGAYESSPNKLRHFCSACGSPIYSQDEKTRGIVSVRCGTLETDPGIRPAMHAYVASKAPWFDICDDVPQKPEGIA